MTPDAVPSAGNRLALLGRHMQLAADNLVASLQLIGPCQEAHPDEARRLEDLRDYLEGITEDLARATHPLLVRRIAEAQKPGVTP